MDSNLTNHLRYSSSSSWLNSIGLATFMWFGSHLRFWCCLWLSSNRRRLRSWWGIWFLSTKPTSQATNHHRSKHYFALMTIQLHTVIILDQI